jgi:hypothetical protein
MKNSGGTYFYPFTFAWFTAVTSSVFQKMFNATTENQNVLKVDGIHSEAMNFIKDYIYSGTKTTLENCSLNVFLEILLASTKVGEGFPTIRYTIKCVFEHIRYNKYYSKNSFP